MATTVRLCALSPEVPTDKPLFKGVLDPTCPRVSSDSPPPDLRFEVMHSLAHNPFTVARLVRRMPRRRPLCEPIRPSIGAVLIHQEGEQ